VQRPDDAVVRTAAEVKPGDPLLVRFADDRLPVRADPPS
jgi:hypothetical protein